MTGTFVSQDPQDHLLQAFGEGLKIKKARRSFSQGAGRRVVPALADRSKSAVLRRARRLQRRDADNKPLADLLRGCWRCDSHRCGGIGRCRGVQQARTLQLLVIAPLQQSLVAALLFPLQVPPLHTALPPAASAPPTPRRRQCVVCCVNSVVDVSLSGLLWWASRRFCNSVEPVSLYCFYAAAAAKSAAVRRCQPAAARGLRSTTMDPASLCSLQPPIMPTISKSGAMYASRLNPK